uniref:Uncharacterized protein n=1 Tax=Rhizophora mucronata TaxID=61149 RepID=A0A2P2PR26_RHIMU
MACGLLATDGREDPLW